MSKQPPSPFSGSKSSETSVSNDSNATDHKINHLFEGMSNIVDEYEDLGSDSGSESTRGIAIVNAKEDDSIEKIITNTDTPENITTTDSNVDGTQKLSFTNVHYSANKPVRLFQSVQKQKPINKPRKERSCKECGNVGHDKRNCPQLGKKGKNDTTTRVPSKKRKAGSEEKTTMNKKMKPNKKIVQSSSTSDEVLQQNATENTTTSTTPKNSKKIDLYNTIYILFDLETTGGSRLRSNITEIASICVDVKGELIDDSEFTSLVNPNKTIPNLIVELTNITQQMVESKPTFDFVGSDWVKHITNVIKDYEHERQQDVSSVILVAHNGRRFDVPFLLHQMKRYNVGWPGPIRNLLYMIDTWDLALDAVSRNNLNIPKSYTLSTLYFYCTGNEIGADAHRASTDIDAMYNIFKYRRFWNNRKNCIYKVDVDSSSIVAKRKTKQSLRSVPSPNDDSDTDDEDVGIVEASDTTEDNNSDDGEDDDDQCYGWVLNTGFDGIDSKPFFEQAFKHQYNTRSESSNIKPGIQCSANSVNSPYKAWKAIFTNGILEKIVKYTNEYGAEKADSWQDISRDDLIKFIACLFVASVQRRKDKTSNWWSSDPILENPVMKKIMTGRQFHTILRYLHVSSLAKQPDKDDPAYDPAYKVQEFQNDLEAKFEKLYIPGQRLSLDETLIRAFGRIKFKVRIISKAARYGIKLYVITDADTSFVLKVIVYTGKSTYQNTKVQEEKKTVQIVKALCEPFEGSYRTVFVDRFYTSVDLLVALDKMKLYVTGTANRNRFPQQIKIDSKESNAMERGAYKKHIYKYMDSDGVEKKFGLVTWKDNEIVYCLTSVGNTNTLGTCEQSTKKEGKLKFPWPEIINEYNQHMGGVDLADMRRLHCNSTIMGQHRWWLKLFFYLLDVGTANALVLYREAMQNEKVNQMNFAQFKSLLVKQMIGDDLNKPVPKNPEHSLVNIEGTRRNGCVYCSLYLSQWSRTRAKCGHPNCNIPLCAISKKTKRDCFSKAHATTEILLACQEQYRKMLLKTNRRGKT